MRPRNDAAAAVVAPLAPVPSRRKLAYKEMRELEQLPLRIEALETRLGELTAALNDPAFFRQDAAAIVAANDTLARTQAELDVAYARWQELEASAS